MKKIVLLPVFLLFLFLSFPHKTFAIFDPLTKPNNMFGIHILFPSELDKAAEMVNSSGGDWGYVTIPIQINDLNLEKWQNFMDKAKEKHLIPLIRLATEPDPFNTNVWRIPTEYDVIDFANFLNSLEWPIENRYVIVFNEVNRFDEWGGQSPNPAEYTRILNFAVDTLKARSPDFFVISAGLDNASPDADKYMKNYTYLKEMEAEDKDVFNKIDGISSHSYPNPGFVASPTKQAVMGTSTYKYEYSFINSEVNNPKPVFITETGWDAGRVGDKKTAEYYKETYEQIWKQDAGKIVAVTPFLLEATGGPFDKFSFLHNGQPTESFKAIVSLPKTKGEPIFENANVADAHELNQKELALEVHETQDFIPGTNTTSQFLKIYFKTLLGL